MTTLHPRGAGHNMEVKLFTLEGIKVTVVHNLILLGFALTWVFINVVFLGNDVTVKIPDKKTMKHYIDN